MTIIKQLLIFNENKKKMIPRFPGNVVTFIFFDVLSGFFKNIKSKVFIGIL